MILKVSWEPLERRSFDLGIHWLWQQIKLLKLHMCNVSTYDRLYNVRPVKAVHAIRSKNSVLSGVDLEILGVAELGPAIEAKGEIDLELTVVCQLFSNDVD